MVLNRLAGKTPAKAAAHAPHARQVKSLRRVLVMVKETYFEQVSKRGDKAQLAEIANQAPGVQNVARSHEQHLQTLKVVKDALSKRGIQFEEVREIADFTGKLDEIDLIVSVGGDGTFLRVSHEVIGKTPVLGVNSAPITSFGHFCRTDCNGFLRTLDAIIDGTIMPIRLLRLELTLNGVPLPELVLNEVLVAHAHPAGTSRYQIEVDGEQAEHKGSGLLIAAPSGSTGFLRSEGGAVLPITARAFSYLKRAPFLGLFERGRLLRGSVAEGGRIAITSNMQAGKLFVDGEHIEYDFPRGARLEVRVAGADLVAYVHPGCHSPYQMEATLLRLPLPRFISAPLAAVFTRISKQLSCIGENR